MSLSRLITRSQLLPVVLREQRVWSRRLVYLPALFPSPAPKRRAAGPLKISFIHFLTIVKIIYYDCMYLMNSENSQIYIYSPHFTPNFRLTS